MNTATQIMIDAAVGSDVLLDMTRKTLDGCDDPFDAAQSLVKWAFARSMVEATLPDFASKIVLHAFEEEIDWEAVGERLIVLTRSGEWQKTAVFAPSKVSK